MAHFDDDAIRPVTSITMTYAIIDIAMPSFWYH